MNPAQAEEVNAWILGRLHQPGCEPRLCPVCGAFWYLCRNRASQALDHTILMIELARRNEPGALFQACAIFGPVLGTQPMTAAEGALIDLVAQGQSVPAHPSACTSAPGDCWHGQIWHKGRSGRLGACSVPACQCAMFVRQEACHRPARVPAGSAS